MLCKHRVNGEQGIAIGGKKMSTLTYSFLNFLARSKKMVPALNAGLVKPWKGFTPVEKEKIGGGQNRNNA
jgi:hypothetical protein